MTVLDPDGTMLVDHELIYRIALHACRRAEWFRATRMQVFRVFALDALADASEILASPMGSRVIYVHTSLRRRT